MKLDTRQLTRKITLLAWIAAPMVMFGMIDAHADDDDTTDEPGESAVDPDEPGAEPHEPTGAHSMGSMTENPTIEEIKDAHGGQAPGHTPKPTSNRTDLTEARDRLFRAFSGRHSEPDCEETDEIADDPVADYAWLVDNVAMPPWVGMRAAGCLITAHASEEATLAVLERWVVEPQSKGVGFLILDRIDDLPEPVAIKVAATAVRDGPDPKEARKRVKQSSRESVRKAYK